MNNADRPTGEKNFLLLAYVVPFALFLILTSLEGFEAVKPYYPWVYAGKLVLVSAALVRYGNAYPSFATAGLGLGVAAGVVGVFLWVGIVALELEAPLRAALPAVFGSGRASYNPFEAIADPAGRWAFIVVRLIGLAVIVPLVEEIFWRGFLMRYFINEDFANVPIGTFTPMSFALVTILFTAPHPELLAALVWGAMINLLLCRTKNLWSAIACHAVTNGLLGAYILTTGAWNLW